MAAISHEIGHAHGPTPSHGGGGGIWTWLTTVDHKRIGILYLLSSAFFFLIGGIEAFIIRLQLYSPNSHLVSSQAFSQLFTMHGTTMIFLAAMPAFIGFINCIVPLQIGARDVAFPKMNALSFWLFFFGGILLNSSWFLGGAPNNGWFNYAPLSITQYNAGPGIDFYDIGLQISGIGTLMTGINFLVTIINMRAPGLTFRRLPLFTWTTLVTSLIILFAFPPLTVNFFLLMFDRLFGTNFFNVAHGGNVMLWQQLFWIFGHPEVYILILPAFGILSEIVPVFSRKPLFGYDTMVFATILIGFLSFMVWTHHLFATGLGPLVNAVFAVSSMAIAIPTGIKIFNYLGTMWGGKIQFTSAMLWVIGFIPTFVLGGMSGVMLAAAPADLQYNDSYFVVAHFHYVIIGGSVFGLLAALFYWFPKIWNRMLDERLGKWSFWLVMIGFNVTFFPMHIVGLLGMPRRVFTYQAGFGFTIWNQISTIGVFVLAAGFLVLLANIVKTMIAGQAASADPWDARTLEWATASPAPEYNFAQVPLIRGLDALWVEKEEGNGRMLPAEPEGPIHMPSPSFMPLLIAFALFVAGYGAIFGSTLVAVIALLVAFYAIVRTIIEEDHGYHIEPVKEGLA